MEEGKKSHPWAVNRGRASGGDEKRRESEFFLGLRRGMIGRDESEIHFPNGGRNIATNDAGD